MTEPSSIAGSSGRSVAVIGGGLAGLATAAAACRRGFRVELFEQRKQLGGRAGSFRDPKTDQSVDFCQHVAMGCCTELADFCRQTGIDDCFAADRTLHFFGPGDNAPCHFRASRWLPAPLHLAGAFFRLRYLTIAQRWSIARTLWRLTHGTRDDRQETIGAWLRRHGQSEQAIERFWSVVLVSALSETVDRASLHAARQVFRDGFMTSRHAYELIVPRMPLGDIFDGRVGRWLEQHGVVIRRGVRIDRIEGDAHGATALVPAGAAPRTFDVMVAAVPWHRIRSLLPEAMARAIPSLAGVERIEPAAITAVHFWFDRSITPLPHAVLVGRQGQWLFNHGENRCEVVVSASSRMPRSARCEAILEELRAIWPAAGDAELLHWRAITQPMAVFSMSPGIESFRPPQRTPIPNLLLAGDWTATGWPATMEGAVRSGRAAAAAL